jgi:uncharacterized protein (TIGR03382 family)
LRFVTIVRVGTLGIAITLLAVAPMGVAGAARPASGIVDDGSLELAGGRRSRAGRQTEFGIASPPRAAAWSRFEAETGIAWASWDRDTEVPSRILLSGVPAPGSMSDAAVALAFAEAFLARHLELLAPGASPSDFVVVANDLSAGMRSIGFAQQHNGLPVIGGQLSFRFKNDRLILVGSEAFPDVAIASRHASVDPSDAADRARDFVLADVAGTHRATGPASSVAILPVIDRGGTLSYHEVVEVEVELDAPRSRFSVFVDAATGAPIARRSTLFHGSSQVRFNVPQQGPLGPRFDAPAPLLDMFAGGPTQTDAGGFVTFPGTSSTVLTDGVAGPFVFVNNATGPNAATDFVASDGNPVVWNQSDDETIDSQLTSFIHASFVKDYVRGIATDLEWLDSQLQVTVNIDDSCNAFSDGDTINFYLSGGGCENTGRLADVVYHEFGHSVHNQSVIPGVGQFSVSLSEGTSDYLAATITEDTGIGRGFTFDESPIRDFNPPGIEYRWPEDRGEVHMEGRIIGGALWDLRALMIAKLGTEAGIAYTDRLWYETTRRAVDIPSMYPEALAFDDDDGNLANGTPNGCEINAAYGPHGLFSAGEGNERVTFSQQADGSLVQLSLQVPNFPGCPVSASPTLEWQVRDDPAGGSGGSEMTLGGDGLYSALIPPQTPGTVLQYRVHLNYSNGAEGPLPDNFVDPWYEMFIGEVVPLKCLGEQWTTTLGGTGNNWIVGPLDGDSAGADPPTGFDDGTHLYQVGAYSPGSNTTISFDAVDTLGYANVRLQYYRWLTVEDGFFDRATILADSVPVWTNYASAEQTGASFAHIDKEWRFHDVDLSAHVADGVVEVAFSLASDQGLEFGGWTAGAMCIVAFDDGLVTCGNGVVDGSEGCDDGNLVPGDGCSASCTVEGDTSDTVGTSDDGSGGGESDSGDEDTDGDTDTADFDGDGLLDRGCACTSAGGGGAAPFFAVVLLGVLGRRRRRSASAPAAE